MTGTTTTLRHHREAAALTQADLARVLGVSRQTIISIELGRYAPSLELALRLAAHFALPVETLFALAPSDSAPPAA